jgi:hypothetical protein
VVIIRTLYGLKLAGAIGDPYLNAPNHEKVYPTAGHKFRSC